MGFDLFLADSSNPLRLPTWRSDIVQDYNVPPEKRQILPDEDKFVLEYVKFIDKYRDARTDRFALRKLRAEQPEIFDCYQLANNDVTDLKTVLESFLLSQASSQDISSVLAFSPSMIDWYERMCFDVRDRLDKRIWLANYIINEYVYASHISQERMLMDASITVPPQTQKQKKDCIFKLCGLYGGPLLIELMYTGFNNRAFPVHVDNISYFIDNTVKDFIRARGAFAAKMLDNSADSMKMLLNLAYKVTESAQEETKTEYQESVTEAMDSLRWTFSADVSNYNNPPQYLNGAVELRTKDIAKTASQLKLDPLLNELEHCSLITQAKTYEDNN